MASLVVRLAGGLRRGRRDEAVALKPLELRACLAVIRPQLVGAIAQDAERVLAEEEDA